MSFMGWGKLTDDGFGEPFFCFFLGAAGRVRKLIKQPDYFLAHTPL
jgi:hypothetical protein